MTHVEVVTEFLPELYQAFENYSNADDVDVMRTCIRRMAEGDLQTRCTRESELAFSRLVGVPETVLSLKPEQARAAYEFVYATRAALDHSLDLKPLIEFVLATSEHEYPEHSSAPD